MDNLHELLEIVGGDETFTTRRIDLLLHTHPSFLNFTPQEQVEYHKRKQEDVLAIAEDYEHELFNDPRVRYPFRKHFNGAAGTMSNILTSQYFTLYANLLEGNFGIQVNVLDDLKTLFAIASSYRVTDGTFAIDEEELDSLKRAVNQLMKRGSEEVGSQYTHSWFKSYEKFLHSIHQDAMASYPFYQENPNQRTFDQVINWKLSRATPAQRDQWQRDGFLPSYDHGHYEYYPPYSNPYWRNQLLDVYLTKLPVLEDLFNKTENRPSVHQAPPLQKS